MINFTLGIIVGMLLAIVAMLAVRRYQTPIERIAKQIENRTKEKGEVFTPNDDVEDFETYLDGLPKE